MERLTLLYGLPRGETERYTERLLSANCKTPADLERVKAIAGTDGWHSFRVATSDGRAPDFANVLATRKA